MPYPELLSQCMTKVTDECLQRRVVLARPKQIHGIREIAAELDAA